MTTCREAEDMVGAVTEAHRRLLFCLGHFFFLREIGGKVINNVRFEERGEGVKQLTWRMEG